MQKNIEIYVNLTNGPNLKTKNPANIGKSMKDFNNIKINPTKKNKISKKILVESAAS